MTTIKSILGWLWIGCFAVSVLIMMGNLVIVAVNMIVRGMA